MIWGHLLVVLFFKPPIVMTLINYDDDNTGFFSPSMGLVKIACFGSLGMTAGKESEGNCMYSIKTRRLKAAPPKTSLVRSYEEK
ncbi:hypothetical protein CRE_05855 [Caenorhabditis remanei]|uniref:Secreted protein n=1 Tax=Caenorhabditis remanei TaxID=31234 RepID=E3MNQ9_CAERE|nr:hypothetical protein CRE_05855 [Caenorhabditis remanei]